MTNGELEDLCNYLNDVTAPAPAPSGNTFYDAIVRLAEHFRNPHGHKWERYRGGIDILKGPTLCFHQNTLSTVRGLGRDGWLGVTFQHNGFLTDEDFLDAINRLFSSDRLDEAVLNLTRG